MLVFISYTVSWNKRLVTLPYPILPFLCHAIPYRTTPCPISNTLPSLFKAPGLSILPFNMIKGRRRLEIEESDVEARLSQCREQQRAIKLKASPESCQLKIFDVWRTWKTKNGKYRKRRVWDGSIVYPKKDWLALSHQRIYFNTINLDKHPCAPTSRNWRRRAQHLATSL